MSLIYTLSPGITEGVDVTHTTGRKVTVLGAWDWPKEGVIQLKPDREVLAVLSRANLPYWAAFALAGDVSAVSILAAYTALNGPVVDVNVTGFKTTSLFFDKKDGRERMSFGLEVTVFHGDKYHKPSVNIVPENITYSTSEAAKEGADRLAYRLWGYLEKQRRIYGSYTIAHSTAYSPCHTETARRVNTKLTWHKY